MLAMRVRKTGKESGNRLVGPLTLKSKCNRVRNSDDNGKWTEVIVKRRVSSRSRSSSKSKKRTKGRRREEEEKSSLIRISQIGNEQNTRTHRVQPNREKEKKLQKKAITTKKTASWLIYAIYALSQP